MQQDNRALLEQWAECVRVMNENPRVTGRARGTIAVCEPRGLMGTTLLIAVPSEATREFLQNRPMSEILDESVGRVLGADTLVAFVVDPELEVQPPTTRAATDARSSDRTIPSLTELEAERTPGLFQPLPAAMRRRARASRAPRPAWQPPSPATAPASTTICPRAAYPKPRPRGRNSARCSAPATVRTPARRIRNGTVPPD